jgi:hypothetical protein
MSMRARFANGLPRARTLLSELGPRLGDHQYVAKLGKAKYLESAFEDMSRQYSCLLIGRSRPDVGTIKPGFGTTMFMTKSKTQFLMFDGEHKRT